MRTKQLSMAANSAISPEYLTHAEPYHPGSGYRGAGTCATVLKLELFDFMLDIDENVVRRDSLIRV